MAAFEDDKKDLAQKKQPNSLCCYSQRVCNIGKLKGFDFCHKHILEDKASPFKPCDFYAKINDKRCMNPAPKMPDSQKSYCLIHTRKAELRRAVEKRKKKRLREQAEDDSEEIYFEKRRRTSSSASQKSLDEVVKDEDQQTSDEEMNVGGSLKVDSAWHGDIDSDAESVDSEEEDYLRHAGVWTTDEVAKMCVDKMTRLKSLYMAQYKRLFHVLKEKRRKYLQLIQIEQDNEGDQYVSPSEVLGMSSHSRGQGVEAILHKTAREKRHGVSSRLQNSSHQRCTHVSDGSRCLNKILPLTKFCIHHISHDPNQLVFQMCTFNNNDKQSCCNVVPKAYPYSTCQLHMRLTSEHFRPNVAYDLEEAAKRDQERKINSEQDSRGKLKPFLGVSDITKQDAQLQIPKALKQKSSALIAPIAQTPYSNLSSRYGSSTFTTESTTNKSSINLPLKLDKLVDEIPSQTDLVGSSVSTPMELMSPISGASTPAGIKSISPTLLAESLVAVCSAAPTLPQSKETGNDSIVTMAFASSTTSNTSSIDSPVTSICGPSLLSVLPGIVSKLVSSALPVENRAVTCTPSTASEIQSTQARTAVNQQKEQGNQETSRNPTSIDADFPIADNNHMQQDK